MYKKLEARLVLIGMTKKKLAEKLGITYNTLLLKLRGENCFTLDEALAIRKIIKADETIEDLFTKTNQQAS